MLSLGERALGVGESLGDGVGALVEEVFEFLVLFLEGLDVLVGLFDPVQGLLGQSHRFALAFCDAAAGFLNL